MARRSVVRAARRFVSENRLDAAAALTYYSVLSIFPAILVGTSVIGMLDEDATAALLEGAGEVVPAEGYAIVETAVGGLQRHSGSAGLLALAGLAGALWAASNWVAAFSRALDAVEAGDRSRRWPAVLAARVVLTVIVGALAAAAAMTAALGGSVARAAGAAIGATDAAVTAWAWVKWPLVLVLVVLIVALLYWLGPSERRGFGFRAPGAALAVALWIAASVLFGLYAADFGSYDKTYGTLGGVIVFLVWLWITNAVLLFGSEFNASAESEAGTAES